MQPQKLMASPQQLALGELEFRKAFLVLSYIERKRLEDVFSVNVLRSLNNLPMATFESEIWKVVGCNGILEKDRRKSLDWDSKKTHLYHCLVDPDGSITFKGPYMHKTRTHLQRVLGDDYVLNVRFAENGESKCRSSLGFNSSNAVYNRIANEGILVGLRLYRFFVFKDGGKEEKKKSPGSSPVKCYFVCTESGAASDQNSPYILFNKSIHEARSMFMHVHMVTTVVKYMPRFSLILSKTIKMELDFGTVHIEPIEDIPCTDEEGNPIHDKCGEPLIHTDGTGFISEDLAMKCPRNVFKGDCLVPGDLVRMLDQAGLQEDPSILMKCKSLMEEPPLLIQFRMFFNGQAVKGTLLVNKRLPLNTIQIRQSMIKVENDQKLSAIKSINSLEIVGTSNRPKKAYLSKFLIALLNYGGVPKKYFEDILRNALDDAQNARSNKRAALRVALKNGEMDDFLVARMILCGIPLDEPFLQHQISILMRKERKGLKGGKLPVSECFYLMGTADPTGTLSRDEVCIILDNGQISGKVLVYRNPGLHFGDIHVLTATYVKDIEKIVGNAKYAIFFPTKGPRSLADEIANGDFDGDMYWVSRNPQLLDSFHPSTPWKWIYSKTKVDQPKPTEFPPMELENEIFKQFLANRFQPSYSRSVAADSWLSYMDRLLTLGEECEEEKNCLREKMLELVDLYYYALDAPKSGMKIEVRDWLKPEKFPHFMERGNSYTSTSVLGFIYDMVEAFQTEGSPSREVWLLPCFMDKVPSASLQLWEPYYKQYREEMSNALKMDEESKDIAAAEVLQKYKQILYGATEYKYRTRRRDDILNEALAIYQISYDYARTNGVGRCSFAWNIASHPLCELYAMKQEEESTICSLSVLREVTS